jgi:glycyl-tRNA synthetase
VQKAQAVFEAIAPHLTTTWDDRGNIGKRYYYQDEIGTPFCVTIDFETLEDNSITVRHRDTMEQERVSVDQLLGYLQKKLESTQEG